MNAKGWNGKALLDAAKSRAAKWASPLDVPNLAMRPVLAPVVVKRVK